jgi:hypothetical protein
LPVPPARRLADHSPPGCFRRSLWRSSCFRVTARDGIDKLILSPGSKDHVPASPRPGGIQFITACGEYDDPKAPDVPVAGAVICAATVGCCRVEYRPCRERRPASGMEVVWKDLKPERCSCAYLNSTERDGFGLVRTHYPHHFRAWQGPEAIRIEIVRFARPERILPDWRSALEWVAACETTTEIVGELHGVERGRCRAIGWCGIE